MSTRSYADFTYDHYRHILRAASDNKYRFISFNCLKTPSETARTCLLRHDCDNDLPAALRMAEIEVDMGVKSTYFIMLRSVVYNALSRANYRMIMKILGLGHEIGLHFNMAFYENEPDSRMADRVDEEREWMRSEFGQEIQVVSFHQPSSGVLDGKVKIHCLNTYSKDDMQQAHYVSDTNMHWYEHCPSVLFEKGDKEHVQLLIHPEWWTAEYMTLEQKWEKMMQDNFSVIQNVWMSVERAYTESKKLCFEKCPAHEVDGETHE